MINQIIEFIKNTALSTVGLIVGLFGVDNADFLNSPDANLKKNQEQSIDLSEYAQANILDAVDIGTQKISEDVTSSDTEIATEIQAPIKKVETEYFVKEDIPTAVFARPESSISSQTENLTMEDSNELITLGEEPIEAIRAINPVKTTKASKKVDVTNILNIDFDKFDTKLQISEITEDTKNFYVAYQYITFAVKNRVWGEILKEKNLSITKKTLKGKDLGDYLSEELSEVIDTEIVYLKEVQKIQLLKNTEENAGALAIVTEEKTRTEASDYVSLIGKVLDTDLNEFGNYQPIAKKEEVKIVKATTPTTPTIPTVPVAEVKTTSTGVVDNEAPLVVIQGNNPALIQLGSTYSDLGAKVTDNISEGLGVKVGGDAVDTSIKGSYFVTYTATDEAGNVATATREVIVYNYEAIPEVEQVVATIPMPAVEPTPQVETIISEEIIPEIKEVLVATSSESIDQEIITPVEEIKITKSKTKKVLETVTEVAGNSLDASAGVVQKTVDSAVEATSEAVGASIEAVQETVGAVVETTGAVVETTIETVSEGVEKVIETTNEIAEQITAMISSINIRKLLGNISSAINFKDLLGNINSSMDFGIGDKLLNILDKTSSEVYENINNAILKTADIFNKIVDGVTNISKNGFSSSYESGNKMIDKVGDIFKETVDSVVVISSNSVSTIYKSGNKMIDKVADIFNSGSQAVYENINEAVYKFLDLIEDSFKGVKYSSKNVEDISQTAQISSNGIYEKTIGSLADNSYRAFNFIWNSIKNISNVKVDLSIFDSTIEGINNKAQIIGGGIFKILEIVGDKVSDASGFFWDGGKNISGDMSGNMTDSISESGSQAGKIISNQFNNGIDLIGNSYQRTKEIFSGVTEKISGKLSLAGIKYSREVEVNNLESVEIEEEMDATDNSKVNKIEFLKDKVLMIGEYAKGGFTKTLNFLKENKPTF